MTNNNDQKKEYTSPKMKVVELKHQSNLMQFSGYNDNYIDIIFNK